MFFLKKTATYLQVLCILISYVTVPPFVNSGLKIVPPFSGELFG